MWIVIGNTMWEVGKVQPRRRQYGTGEPDAARSCLSGSEGAGRKRTAAMGQRAVLRPYLHELDRYMESNYLNLLQL